MMQILKETTVWNTDSNIPNHTYLLDGDKLIAYAVRGGDEIRTSPSRMKIDKRGRSFVVTKHPGLQKFISGEKPEDGVRSFKINSKDKVYFVTVKKGKYTCTCTGFNYRGKCKHVDAVASKLEQST